MVELTVLGRLDLNARTEPGGSERERVSLQPKRLALLTYLVLARPRGPQQRDSLLALFWPDSSESNARNALNQSLHSLRSALGAGVMVSEGRDRVGVARERIWCDGVAFDEAYRAERHGDALELYGGELLPGFHVRDARGFERWMDAERTRLRRQARTSAIALADRSERAGNPVGAARWVERALEVAPADETLVRRLVALLNRAGDRAGALRAYDRFADDLRAQFSTEPSPETRELVASIRDRREGHTGDEETTPSEGTSRKAKVRSLAVLPLDDLRGDPAQRYFVEGLTEALIGELARIGSLRVISRQSVLRFRDTDRPLDDIGAVLDVDALVEGSVLRVDDRIRLNIQLLRVDPEEHLWSEAFERDLEDVLALHRDVARAVASRIEGVVAPTEPEEGVAPPGEPRKVSPAAYDAFLRGAALLTRQRGEPDFATALPLLHQAIEIDPEFGEPLAWIALAYANMVTAGLLPPDEAEGPMREAAARAIELDRELGPAHLARALVLQLFARDWEGAEDAYRRAAASAGGTAHEPWKSWLVLFLVGQGRFGEGLALARDELLRDPIGPAIFTAGWALHKARRHEAAIDRLEMALQVAPRFPANLPFLAASYLFAGRITDAVETARKTVEVGAEFPTLLAYAAATLAGAGEPEESRGLLRELEGAAKETYVDPFNLALAHAGLGEHDRALDALERLAAEGSPQSYIVAPEPFFDPLRGEPRFDTVLAELGLPRLEF